MESSLKCAALERPDSRASGHLFEVRTLVAG